MNCNGIGGASNRIPGVKMSFQINFRGLIIDILLHIKILTII